MMLAFDEDGTVRDVAFSGRGCAISQASASLLTDEIKGRSLGDAEALTNQDVLDLLGIEISPARLKCALLSLDTLAPCAAEARAELAVSASRHGQPRIQPPPTHRRAPSA